MAPSSFYTQSPTAVLTPQYAPDQYFHDAHYRQAEPMNISGLPTPSEPFKGLSITSLPPTPGALAGQKRSRGDDLSPEEEHPDGSFLPTQPLEAPNNEPVYGPGMTLIYPSDPSGHYSPDQSGTWQGQRAEQSVNGSPTRPILASRKSQRLDNTAFSSDKNAPAMPRVSTRAPGTEPPLIDEATRLLGISWVRMDNSEALQIAQRAYTRWIQRHYSGLTNVQLWFENNAIPGYLGHATNQANGLQEFYLWSQDLHQAILVTREPSDLIIKLSQPHMSLSQATEIIRADIEPVVEASACNAAILRNDRFLIDINATAGSMEVD